MRKPAYLYLQAKKDVYKRQAEWSHKATAEDLEATKLSLINSVVTTYYQISYLNDAISTTEEDVYKRQVSGRNSDLNA